LEEFVVTVPALLRCIGIDAISECTHSAAPNIAAFYVPMVLKMQSHQIPNDLEKFLSAVRDMEKWFEYKKTSSNCLKGMERQKKIF